MSPDGPKFGTEGTPDDTTFERTRSTEFGTSDFPGHILSRLREGESPFVNYRILGQEKD